MTDIWQVDSIPKAKRVILTGDTDKRWDNSLDDAIDISYVIPFGGDILDFGCGIGRMSKAFLDSRTDVSVYGVDTSASMLKLAREYVGTTDRLTLSNRMPGDKFDLVWVSYVLQHMEQGSVYEFVETLLHSGSNLLCVTNMFKRRVWNWQTDKYEDDGFDIEGLLNYHFRMVKELPAEPCHFSRIYKARI